MSKGPGRVQRAILETLERRGPEDVYMLALYAGARRDSVGRALRRLRRARAVVFLGWHGRGGGLWCLPSQEEEARAHLLPPELLPDIVRLLGVRQTRSLARAYVSDLPLRWQR